MHELILRNRQRLRPIRSRLLRRIARGLLDEGLGMAGYSLGIHLVGVRKMTRLNHRFLGHTGSTDVITFDHSHPAPGSPSPAPGGAPVPLPAGIHGEIFICVDEALSQARRFRSTWQAELVRYLVHGVLHLVGFDDTTPAARKAMKQEERRRLRCLAREFDFSQLAARGRAAGNARAKGAATLQPGAAPRVIRRTHSIRL